MVLFLIFTSLIFLFLTIVWSRTSWLNTIIKLTFIIMTGWSLFMLFTTLGFVVKL